MDELSVIPEDAARDYIAQRVKEGASREAIVQELLQRGYDPSIAADMVGAVKRGQAVSARKAGLGYLIGGIVITVLSIAATVGSYGAAEAGGTYVICWGAALFGIYMIIRGIRQLVGGREVK
jgi:predicted phage tail protein